MQVFSMQTKHKANWSRRMIQDFETITVRQERINREFNIDSANLRIRRRVIN